MADTLVTAKRSQDKTQVVFGSNLDVAAAASLKSELGKVLRRKPPFEFDGSAIERIDAAGLQVLLAFVAENRARDHEFRWTDVSEALKNASALTGVDAGLGLSN